MTPEQDRHFRRQTAIRRTLLGPDGKLTRDGRVLATYMQRLCYAHHSQTLVALDNNGSVDPIGTAARAARREMWDKLVTLLNQDTYAITNMTED